MRILLRISLILLFFLFFLCTTCVFGFLKFWISFWLESSSNFLKTILLVPSKCKKRTWWETETWQKQPGSRSKMFFKISVLKNFAIFTGIRLCWSLLLIKLRPGTMYECCQIFKKIFFYRRPLVAASDMTLAHTDLCYLSTIGECYQPGKRQVKNLELNIITLTVYFYVK